MTTPLLLLVLALVGLGAGSFVNTVIVRVPAGEPVLRPGRRCPSCEHPTPTADRIPVLSWLGSGRRCRNCDEPVPAGYPLVELANAALWVAAGLRFGADWELIPYLALFSVLLALSVIDLELYILPNRITYPSILVSLAAVAVFSFITSDEPGARIAGAVIGGVAYAGFLLLTLLAYELVVHKEGMGMGDVKLAVLLGIWIGWLNPLFVLHALIAASLIGLVAGAAVLAVRRKSQPYPFGPWLALGAVVVILASYELAELYGL